MFNPDMVHDGCAFEYTYDKPYRYQAQFCAAEADARTSERGLWYRAQILRSGASATITFVGAGTEHYCEKQDRDDDGMACEYPTGDSLPRRPRFFTMACFPGHSGLTSGPIGPLASSNFTGWLSTLTAYPYITSPDLARGIWDALQKVYRAYGCVGRRLGYGCCLG